MLQQLSLNQECLTMTQLPMIICSSLFIEIYTTDSKHDTDVTRKMEHIGFILDCTYIEIDFTVIESEIYLPYIYHGLLIRRHFWWSHDGNRVQETHHEWAPGHLTRNNCHAIQHFLLWKKEVNRQFESEWANKFGFSVIVTVMQSWCNAM